MIAWCLSVLVVKAFKELLGYACEHIPLDKTPLLW
jgi:hypothetical protein